MYKKNKPSKTILHINQSMQGETITTKVARITQQREPIKDGAPMIYTERKEGVLPEYDIRTDRFEVALDAMDIVSKTHIAKREQRAKTDDTPAAQAANNDRNNTGGEPSQATS